MRLEIRDIDSAMVYDIGPEGAVLGRERARTDIAFRDESISKRHARIFHDGKGWYLEDLNSSNGTYVQEQRITAPVPLLEGGMFSLAQRRFEVVSIDGLNGEAALGPPPHLDLADDGPIAPPSSQPGVHAFAVASGSPIAALSSDEEEPAGGFPSLLTELPRAVAHFVLHVPLMAVNPIGAIGRGAAQQPHPPSNRWQIAAFAIVSTVFTALVSGVCAFIAALIGGAVNLGALIAVLPAAAIGGAVAGVLALFFHPILRWLVSLFRGQSTVRSRTNYAIAAMTFSVLSAVPNGLALIIASVPVPFVHLLGPLLQLAVTGAGLYLGLVWVRAFALVRWVEYVVMVLGALAVLATGYDLVSRTIQSVRGGGVPASVAAIAPAGAEEAASDATKAAEEAARSAEEAARVAEASDLTPEQRAALEANPMALEALKQADDLRRKGREEGTAAKEAADPAKVPDAPDREPSRLADPPPAAPARDPSADARKSEPRTEAPKTVAEDLAVSTAGVIVDEHPLGMTPFVVYLQKREAVERAIADNPALIREAKIRNEYEKLWKITYEVRTKYGKQRGVEVWKKDKIQTRYKDLEVFEKTQSVVDRLYDGIFER